MFTVYGFFIQLLTCTLLLASGTTNAQKVISVKEVNVNINFENEGITSVFNKIRNSYGYKFVYDKKDLDKSLKLNGQYQDGYLYDVLVDISKKTNLGFRQVNNTITVKKLRKQLLIGNNTPAVEILEDITVTGSVKDENGGTLPGVNVLIDGTSEGSVTDLEGTYKITVTSSDAVLVFSFVGYKNQSIAVGNQKVIDIRMDPDISALNEVVVTALGIEREDREIGYAVSQVNGDEISQAQQVNPVNGLQGKTSGVQVSTTSGGTFGGSRITIRGNSTLQSNTQPLFVIDGVMMDNDISGTGGEDWGNQLKNLNADDFESLSILKGAAAAALYGSRAINGVVMIITKSGKNRKGIGVSINQTTGTRYISDEVAFQNDFGLGKTAGGFTFDTNGPDTYPRDDKHDTRLFNYYDQETNLPSMAYNMYEESAGSWGPRFAGQEIIDYDGSRANWVAQPDNYRKTFDRGILTNTNIALDGGSENNTFRMSFSNFNETGVSHRNDFEKKSLSLKGTQQLIKNKLSVGGLIHYTRSKASNPVNSNGNSDWFHDGFSRSDDVDKWRNNYTDVDGGVPYPTGTSAYLWTRRSVNWMRRLEDVNERTESSLVAKANVDYQITDNLKATVEGSINQYSYTSEAKDAATNADRLNGRYSLENGERFQSTFDAKLIYNKELNEEWNLDAIVGTNLWSTKTISTGWRTNGFNVRDFFNITNSRNPASVYGGLGPQRKLNSLYAFVNTGFKDRLFFSVTARNDWSSSLTYPDGTGNNSYFYHSESVSWMANESLSLPSFISSLKVRASYAEVGNDTAPYTLSTGFVSNGIASSNIPMYKFENGNAVSPNIKPERKQSIEAGFNLLMAQGLVSFDVNFYKDNTKDQILPLSVAAESGLSSIFINGGNIQNSGIELNMDVTIFDRKDFSWNVGFNWTHNRDKIIDLYPGITEYNMYGNPNDANAATASYAYVGGNYGDLVTRKGYKPYDGVNTANHDIPILAPRNGWSVAYPIGIQNRDSLLVMGNMQADWYGAVNTSLRYKRFSLSALIDTRWGGELYSADARYGLHQGVIESSLPNRDRENGGIVWTSNGQGQNFFGKEYEDGYIPTGVFPDGTTITSGPSDNRTSVDVGGMTYQEAYDDGLVEPTHWSGYVYRWTSASTGTPLTGVYTQKWIALRELSISYQLPGSIAEKLKMQSASVSLTGRDLGFIYNSMPDNINPSISNNVASNPLQMRSAPFISSLMLAVKLKF
jgi:iron complex outermembrane receptor protein